MYLCMEALLLGLFLTELETTELGTLVEKTIESTTKNAGYNINSRKCHKMVELTSHDLENPRAVGTLV